MVHTVNFDSTNSKMVDLACGYISLNKIVFQNEKVTVLIESRTGNVDFCDLEENKLLSTNVPLPLSGDEKFSEVKCSVEAEQIVLGFPKYSYKDNYPHCDGEHDRWTKTISGFDFLRYDMKNNCIV